MIYIDIVELSSQNPLCEKIISFSFRIEIQQGIYFHRELLDHLRFTNRNQALFAKMAPRGVQEELNTPPDTPLANPFGWMPPLTPSYIIEKPMERGDLGGKESD